MKYVGSSTVVPFSLSISAARCDNVVFPEPGIPINSMNIGVFFNLGFVLDTAAPFLLQVGYVCQSPVEWKQGLRAIFP